MVCTTGEDEARGNQVGYTAAGSAICTWNRNDEDANNVGPADARIRGMVEETVEAILPGSPNNGRSQDGGLDEASVERHPAYGTVYERHEPALAAALAALQRALLDGADANTAATKLAALVHALGADSQVTASATTTTTTQPLPLSPTPLHDRTYEDILATAIVNKVIERCQQQKLLVSSPESQTESHKRRRRRARGRSTKSSESLSRSPSPSDRRSSRSFVSSLEVRLGASGISGSSGSASGSGCSATSANGDQDYDESDSWSEPLALTVEETLEETTMSTVLSDESDPNEEILRKRRGPEPADKLDFFLCGINFLNRKNRVPFPELGADIVDNFNSEGSDIDDSMYGGSDDEKEREDEEEEDTPATVVQIASPLGTWEDNWLFQSRKLKTPNNRGHQPVPVPMLVPNPSQDLRPLIGEIDAEETSDLSECSDDAIQDVVLAEGEGLRWGDDDIAEACNTLLLQQAASDKDSELTVLYAAPDRRPAPAQRVVSPLGDHDEDSGQASLESTGVHAEIGKVSTDAIAPESTPEATPSPPPSFVPIPAPRPHLLVQTLQPAAEFPSITSEPAEKPTERRDDEENSDSDSEMSAPPRPGTIAAREHEKWQHAVPLPNNPYSLENIEKRLRQRGRLIDLPEVSSVVHLESTGPTLPADHQENGGSQRIHVSVGSKPDPRRYSRDFYVNADTNGCKESSPVLDKSKGPIGPKGRAARGHGRVRQEKNLSSDARTSGDGDRGPEQELLSLPSVKQLARNFVGSDETSLVDKSCSLRCPEESSLGRSVPERKVVIVDLESRNHQVHSLTARSMPRAFREGLRHLSPPVSPVRVACSTPKSVDRPDPEGAGANDTTRR